MYWLRMPPPKPKIGATGRRRVWYLNIDWQMHRQALLDEMSRIAPAPGTTSVAVHTSPECRMTSTCQRIGIARGCFNHIDHATAMQRLRFMRTLHAAWRRRRAMTGTRGASMHEQPPCATCDHFKKYNEKTDWPWAVALTCPRVTVNACMVGLLSEAGLPIYKGWRFESDSHNILLALKDFRCSRDHQHAVSKLNCRDLGTKRRARKECPVINIKPLEKYPLALGSLLANAAAVVWREP